MGTQYYPEGKEIHTNDQDKNEEYKNQNEPQGFKYKFGIKVPRIGDIRGARQLDRENDNTLWFDAQIKEATALRNLGTFEIIPEGYDLSGYQYAPLIYTFDDKFDGCCWACLVANGSVTVGPPESEVWSGVVSSDTV